MMSISDQVLAVFQKQRDNASLVALHEPYMTGDAWIYVKDCLETGWVSSTGKYVDRFEQDLAAFTDAKYAVVTVNGTAALHICYLLAGVQTNDEVLMPTLTFVATPNAARYCQATPHFIDCENTYLGIDVEKLSYHLKEIAIIKNKICYNKITGRVIRALCVMHTFGHPVDLDPLIALSQQYNFSLIEDAAEALGSIYKNRHVGHHGLVGSLSFNGNKIITTGGGGAILTDNEMIAKKAKHLTTTAKKPHAWAYHHDMVGYNYRLPNINAALGCAQLEKILYFLNIKRSLAEQYRIAFSAIPHIRFLTEPAYAKSNYWLNAILVKNIETRDTLIRKLSEEKIGVRPAWELMHQLPMFSASPRMDLSQAEKIAQQIINLPSSVSVGVNLCERKINA